MVRVLGDAKVNILGFCMGTGSGGDVHLIVDDSNKAKKALSALGVSFKEADVLYQELPNVAGALGYFAGKLANKEINVTSGWGDHTEGVENCRYRSWRFGLGYSGPGSLVGQETVALATARMAWAQRQPCSPHERFHK